MLGRYVYLASLRLHVLEVVDTVSCSMKLKHYQIHEQSAIIKEAVTIRSRLSLQKLIGSKARQSLDHEGNNIIAIILIQGACMLAIVRHFLGHKLLKALT